jgi:predicted nicotinamide N-methyase
VIALNAEANDVNVEISASDLLADDSRFDPSSIDVVLVGDGFYDHALSPRVYRFAQRCRAAACEVLVGDPGRADLPIQHLRKVSEHLVPVTHDCQYSAAESGTGEGYDIHRAAVWSLDR